MKMHKFITVLLIAAVSLAAFPEKADAQVRRRKVKVMKPRVVVVKAHPRVVRRAHVRYAALPRWGAAVAMAPAGAVILGPQAAPYYYHSGIYYTRRANNYVIVRPARGIRMKVLPVGYRNVVVGPRHYYYYYGTFYAKAGNAQEYVVVDPPQGAIVDALPDGYEVKTVNDTEYYVLDGVYYAEVDSPDIEGGVGYEVVKM
jgi:hypothetical protein